MEANPDKPWNYAWLSKNPNITWDIVEANPDKSWCFDALSRNPNITWKIVEENLDKPWNYGILFETIKTMQLGYVLK